MSSMIKVKIYYHDTDCGGVVYYANYLKYLEQARTEFFAEKGVSIKELADSGIYFVVARQELDYKSTAAYGDILEVYAQTSSVSAVRIEFEHEVKNSDGKVVCQGKTLLVCVDKDFKPKAMPQGLREKIA